MTAEGFAYLAGAFALVALIAMALSWRGARVVNRTIASLIGEDPPDHSGATQRAARKQ